MGFMWVFAEFFVNVFELLGIGVLMLFLFAMCAKEEGGLLTKILNIIIGID